MIILSWNLHSIAFVLGIAFTFLAVGYFWCWLDMTKGASKEQAEQIEKNLNRRFPYV